MKKHDVVKHILRNTDHGNFVNPNGGIGWAPSNVALCKYWGKRNTELNLPYTSSLSVSLGSKGSLTRIKQDGNKDRYVLNGKVIDANSKFAIRLKKFLDLFRLNGACYFIDIKSNVPVAAGFASSACGFASLIRALDNFYSWDLDDKELSILARLGSGSASRSIKKGFVEWQRGKDDDGMDSYSIRLDYEWPELRVGMLNISDAEKPISSTEAMERTVNSSLFYSDWENTVVQDLAVIKKALQKKDFELLGETAENNAIAMHALMKTANPPINYSLPATIDAIKKVQTMRVQGVLVFFTQDAGSNLQLLFLADDEDRILQEFPRLDVVIPFDGESNEEIILVDANDDQVGVGKKLDIHKQGKLHRAFSIFVLRKHNGKIETLLQQRAPIKYHSANLWANTCCGHPRPGENIIDAAKRRLKEEMGFIVELNEVARFQYRAEFNDVNLIENELDHLLIGYTDLDNFPYDLTEVQDFCWVDLDELKHDLKKKPQKYTAWLPYALKSLLL